VANVDEVKGTQRDRFDPKGGNDILIGGADTDIIYGGTGNDIIDGGDGNDELYGEDGFDTIYGGSGADEIYGGSGGDTIYGERDPGAVAGKFDSQDLGTDGDDIIYGQDGRDTIHGDGGDDEIYGGSGADKIYGDADNDEIYGEGDPDIIYGGWGDDIIDGGAGSDVIFGDNGPDDFVAVTTGGPWNATVYGVNVPGEYLFGTTKSENPLAEDANDTIYSGMDSDFLDGQAGYDTYIIRLEGADNRAFTNVYDSGEDVAETDYMQIFGTMYGDEFLLRANSSIIGLAFVALLNEDPNVERINYWNLERMLVTGSFGDDYFAVDDIRAETTITGDVGEDRFQVGQLYRSPRDLAVYDYNHVETEDVFATIETTVGWLSNGISMPMTIYGGTENDYFTVFHNKAVLSLFGEDGDDTFLIKAFALAGSQEPVRERTDVSGGAGADLVQYAMNAPVNIDGGDGFDTVIIIGTEFGDDFVVTKDGVYGAGLNVNFVNIESLSVDGAEGDDRFYVLSTGEKFITQIFGGLGSDTFNMSGPTPPIISNDLRGHSGVITHSIENTGTSYDVTKIAGISANIVLSKSPGTGSEVVVQVMAPVQTQDQKERESKAFRVSSTSATASTPDGTTVSLTFDEFNWFTPQIVKVSALKPRGNEFNRYYGVSRFSGYNHLGRRQQRDTFHRHL
jgi:Ca2+-binding RTX toxin-like protein